MASFVHHVNLQNHKQVQIQIQSPDDAVIVSSHAAQRVVNTELVRKMGLLITSGQPQLLIDEAKGIISWQVPFLVQPPPDDSNVYPTGETALVDGYTGDYVLDEDSIARIRKAALPIINQLYPDMNGYLKEIQDVAKTL